MSASDEETLRMIQVLSSLYCRPIFNDFRKPVELLYPRIVNDYFLRIEHPVDVGSLLVKAKYGELCIEELRKSLKLVSRNCIKYNGDRSIMVNIANHFDSFAHGMFEEVMNKPYLEDVEEELFTSSKLKSRQSRLEFVQFENLNDSELKKLIGLLRDLRGPIPATALALIKEQTEDIVKILHERLNEVGAGEDESGRDFISIADILYPIIQATTENRTLSEPASGINKPVICPEGRYPTPDFSTFLSVLDDAIGVLTVFIQERLLRGNNHSSRWIRPANTVVWGQPPKDGKGKAPWWPAFIVASGSKHFPLSSEVSKVNLARLTQDIRSGLYKLRPKSNQHTGATAAAAAAIISDGIPDGCFAPIGGADSVSVVIGVNAAEGVVSEYGPMEVSPSPTAADQSPASQSAAAIMSPPVGMIKALPAKKKKRGTDVGDVELVCPEGYLLIEFFGSHDFGWIKADICLPFAVESKVDAEGNAVHSYNPPPNTNKLCNPDFIKEALAATVYLNDTVLLCGEATEDDLDISLPSLNELEDSVTLPIKRPEAVYDPTIDAPPVRPKANGKAEGGDDSKGVSSTGGKAKGGVKRKLSPELGVGEDGAAEEGGAKKKVISEAMPIPEAIGQIFNPAHEECIERGIFRASMCSLARPRSTVGTELCESAAFRFADVTYACEVAEDPKLVSLEALLPPVDKTNYKANAIHRSHAVAYWMEWVKPLGLQGVGPTKHNRATLALANKYNGTNFTSPSMVNGHSVGASGKRTPSAKAKGTAAAIASAANKSNLSQTDLMGTPDRAETPSVASVSTSKSGEKRKYVWKNKPGATTSAVNVSDDAVADPGDSAVKVKKEVTSASPQEPVEKTRKVPGERSYNNTHLTNAGTNCFLLDTGCSRFFKGEGSVHTRVVDLSAPVMHLESRSRAKRKALLRAELEDLKSKLAELQRVASQRNAEIKAMHISVQNNIQNYLGPSISVDSSSSSAGTPVKSSLPHLNGLAQSYNQGHSTDGLLALMVQQQKNVSSNNSTGSKELLSPSRKPLTASSMLPF